MASFAPSATSTVDPTYGQRSVFGGDGFSTAPVDADLDCEDEQEALAYLQLVRNEASKIPHVLVAPRPGPQAFPPGYAAAAAAAATSQSASLKKKRRRRRHWDEHDDGVEAQYAGSDDFVKAAKKRRVSREQAVAVELSYDDEDAGNGVLSYDDEEKQGKAPNDDDKDRRNESEDGYDVSDDDAYEPDFSLDRRILYESSVGDARGYYNDGAYVAAPIDEQIPAAAGTQGNRKGQPSATHLSGEFDVVADREADSAQFRGAYRSRLLLTHFSDMRAIFHSAPADPGALAIGVAALPPDHGTDVGPLSASSGVFRRWLHLLRTTDPLPAQVAAMDKVSVLRLLRILLRGLLTGGSVSSRSSRAARFARSLAGGSGGGNGGLYMTARTSRWLWALFARLPDRGELDYREVGYIRDVAKQAVMRLAHLSYDMTGTDTDDGEDEAEEEADLEEYDEQADGGEEGEEATAVEETVAAGHIDKGIPQDDVSMDARSESAVGDPGESGTENQINGQEDGEDAIQQQDADDQDDEINQRATLEMVLTVVGEFYGQRDLLAFQTPW
ncbi:hypothetical protein SEPCBS57363_005471 [Sporothrix epigloea]|uniref:Uncharacterized protein n=1 Tax=Sporothrix epigloea TaxID=1892477 RepID=A0ABP0DXR2_9PEZI